MTDALTFTNLDAPLFTESRATKGDLVRTLTLSATGSSRTCATGRCR